jgi:hypothetical protein
MEDDVGLLEDLLKRRIEQVLPAEVEAVVLEGRAEVPLLDLRVVVDGEGIDADDLVTTGQKEVAQVRTDESRPPWLDGPRGIARGRLEPRRVTADRRPVTRCLRMTPERNIKIGVSGKCQ